MMKNKIDWTQIFLVAVGFSLVVVGVVLLILDLSSMAIQITLINGIIFTGLGIVRNGSRKNQQKQEKSLQAIQLQTDQPILTVIHDVKKIKNEITTIKEQQTKLETKINSLHPPSPKKPYNKKHNEK